MTLVVASMTQARVEAGAAVSQAGESELDYGGFPQLLKILPHICTIVYKKTKG